MKSERCKREDAKGGDKVREDRIRENLKFIKASYGYLNMDVDVDVLLRDGTARPMSLSMPLSVVSARDKACGRGRGRESTSKRQE